MNKRIKFIVIATVIFFTLLLGKMTTITATEQLKLPSAEIFLATEHTEEWHTVQGANVSLSLPNTYQGGDPNSELEEITKALVAISPDFNSRIALIKQSPQAIALIAFDTKNISNKFLENVNIVKDELPENISLAEYLDKTIPQLSDGYTIDEQQIVSLPEYQARKITIANQEFKQLLYLVPNNNQIYIVTYSTIAKEFNSKKAIFEQSFQSIKFN